jgi:mono/diheme cytochrome c family protein
MGPRLKAAVLAVGPLVVAGVLALAVFIGGGVSARPEPGGLEGALARTVRDAAIRWHAGGASNPVARTPETLENARHHWADHCASCHGSDGSGNTALGRGLYPRAPDMRLTATQERSDAELFYIIENGVRLTGMAAWGTGTAEGEAESWELVHFIRELPRLTPEDIKAMEAMTPRSLDEVRQELEEERFLRGDAP